MMDPGQSPGLLERVIRIRTEYLEQMKAALDKVRREYRAEYRQFIASINTESEEVTIIIIMTFNHLDLMTF